MGVSTVLGAVINFTVLGEGGIQRAGVALDRLKGKFNTFAKEIAHGSGDTLATFSTVLGISALAMELASRKLNAALGSSIDEVRKFQLEMKNLQYASGMSNVELEKTNKRMIEYGQKGIFSAAQYAEAMYELSSAGMTATRTVLVGNKAMTMSTAELALQTTTELVNITRGHMNLQQASELTVALVNKLGISFDKLTVKGGRVYTELDRVGDKIAAVSRLTAIKPEELPTIMDSLRATIQLSGSTVEETLALVGQLRNAGYTAAEAGQAVKEIVRSMSMMGGKWLQKDLYDSLRGMGKGLGANFSKNLWSGADAYDDPMRKFWGVGGGMRGERLVAWMNAIFGSRAEFDKAIKDKKGDFNSLIDFFGTISDKMEAKGMGKADEAFLSLKLFGSAAAQATFKTLMDSSKTEIEGVFEVVDEAGKVIRTYGEVGKTTIYEGFDAMRILRAQINQSEGELKKYSDTMMETSMMINKVWEAAQKTFSAAFGATLLPWVDMFTKWATSFLNLITDFIVAFPFLGKILGALIGVLGVFLFLGAKILAVFIVGAFAISKYRAGLKSLMLTGLNYIEQQGIQMKQTMAQVATQEALNASLKKTALYQSGGFIGGKWAVKDISGKHFISKEAAIAQGLIPAAGITAATTKAKGFFSVVGGGLVTVAKGIGKLTLALAGMYVIWKMINAVVNIFVKLKNSIFGTVDEGGLSGIGKFFLKWKVILTAILTGKGSKTELHALGPEGVGEVVDFLKSDLGYFLRSLVLILQKIYAVLSGEGKIKESWAKIGEGTDWAWLSGGGLFFALTKLAKFGKGPAGILSAIASFIVYIITSAINVGLAEEVAGNKKLGIGDTLKNLISKKFFLGLGDVLASIVGGWGGWILGGKFGAALGAMIGGPIGATILGLLGSIFGGLAGEKVVTAVWEGIKKIDWMKIGGAIVEGFKIFFDSIIAGFKSFIRMMLELFNFSPQEWPDVFKRYGAGINDITKEAYIRQIAAGAGIYDSSYKHGLMTIKRMIANAPQSYSYGTKGEPVMTLNFNGFMNQTEIDFTNPRVIEAIKEIVSVSTGIDKNNLRINAGQQ